MKAKLMIFVLSAASLSVVLGNTAFNLTNDVLIDARGMRLAITDEKQLTSLDQVIGTREIDANSRLFWLLRNTSSNQFLSVLSPSASNAFEFNLKTTNGMVIPKTDMGIAMSKGPKSLTDFRSTGAKRIQAGMQDLPSAGELFHIPSNGVYILEIQYWTWMAASNRFVLSPPVKLRVKNNQNRSNLPSNPEEMRARVGWLPKVQGQSVSSLRPESHFAPSSNGWEISIYCIAEKDFPARSWSKVTNEFGAKLELWTTNGTRILSTNPAVKAAFHLPKQTTVAEIRKHSIYPRHKRGYQWWNAGHPVKRQGGAELSRFDLGSAFGRDLTGDYVLRITPLIYKVDTNLVNAELVELPSINVKLDSAGGVQQLE